MIGPLLSAHLELPTTTLCTCWRIDRTDGVTLRFTDLDRDVSFDGEIYKATTGYNISSTTQSSDMSIDSIDVQSVLDSSDISEEDIYTGRYDDAVVEIFRINWQELPENLVGNEKWVVRRGVMGDIEHGDFAFNVELRGVSERLNSMIGELAQPNCSAVFGDERCRFDLDSIKVEGVEVVSVFSRTRIGVDLNPQIVDPDDPSQTIPDVNRFKNGRFTVETGPNAGLVGDIQDLANGALDMFLPLPNALTPGDTLTVFPGCDKTYNTCREVFFNLDNFTGLPFLPGIDRAMMPGRREGTTGSSGGIGG